MMTFLKSVTILSVCVVMMLSPSMSVAQYNDSPQFSMIIQDLPLMPSMIEDESDDVVFDKAEGRIVQTSTIVSATSPDDIYEFYAQTLPQMGWQKISTGQYRRGGEILTLQTERIGPDSAAYFSVRPQ